MVDGNDIRTVTLLLTNACNLDCIYCYEKYKSKQYMNYRTAKTIIDSELRETAASGYIIDLFGGEPFLCFDTIKEIVDYVILTYPDKSVRFSISTNGTLVHGDIKEWLIKYRDYVMVGLSFDGNRDMQNINRSNSYELVDLSFFQKYFANQKIKMTVSPSTLVNLAEGVIFLHQMGFKVACNLAFGIDWSNPEYQGILEAQLLKLVNFYVDNPQIEPCSMLNLALKFIDGEYPTNIRKWCGTGTHMVAYDASGNKYPCHFFLPITIGEEKAIAAREIAIPETIPLESVDEKCKKCKVSRVCPTCIGSNYNETGRLFIKSNEYCRLMKIIIRANSFLYALKLEKGLLEVSEQDKKRLMRGIFVAQAETYPNNAMVTEFSSNISGEEQCLIKSWIICNSPSISQICTIGQHEYNLILTFADNGEIAGYRVLKKLGR